MAGVDVELEAVADETRAGTSSVNEGGAGPPTIYYIWWGVSCW